MGKIADFIFPYKALLPDIHRKIAGTYLLSNLYRLIKRFRNAPCDNGAENYRENQRNDETDDQYPVDNGIDGIRRLHSIIESFLTISNELIDGCVHGV